MVLKLFWMSSFHLSCVAFGWQLWSMMIEAILLWWVVTCIQNPSNAAGNSSTEGLPVYFFTATPKNISITWGWYFSLIFTSYTVSKASWSCGLSGLKKDMTFLKDNFINVGTKLEWNGTSFTRDLEDKKTLRNGIRQLREAPPASKPWMLRHRGLLGTCSEEPSVWSDYRSNTFDCLT